MEEDFWHEICAHDYEGKNPWYHYLIASFILLL